MIDDDSDDSDDDDDDDSYDDDLTFDPSLQVMRQMFLWHFWLCIYPSHLKISFKLSSKLILISDWSITDFLRILLTNQR